MSNWSEPLTFKEIDSRSRSLGAKIAPDSGPLSDNLACFIKRDGSSIFFDGLDGNKSYWLWIDFVVYSRINSPIQAWLDVVAGSRVIATIRLMDVTTAANPYRIAVPFEHTASGTVSITFRDRSYGGGLWGIWDVMLSDSDAVPGKSVVDAPSSPGVPADGIKARVVDRKTEPEKAHARIRKDAPRKDIRDK